MSRPPRRILPLVGTRDQTRRGARQAVEGLPPERVLWVSAHEEGALSHAAIRRLLGGSAHAVVLDGHDGLHADLLASLPGFLYAGGTLVLRLGPRPVAPPHLAVHPSRCIHDGPGVRFERRVRGSLEGAPRPPTRPLAEAVPPEAGSPEQATLVHELASSAEGPASLHAIVAPRGRGKSTALGRALAHAREQGHHVALCAPDPAAGAIALDAGHGRFDLLDPHQALDAGPLDILAVDEAARLPVPWLLALVQRHRGTLWFATTTGGYEGTGQGFVLRFLASLATDPRPVVHHRLVAPIRWASNDPLEGWLDRILLDRPGQPPQTSSQDLAFEAVSSDNLSGDEGLLRQVYGLLQHAHYRTTPADLQRLLDSPNLRLHVARSGERVVGVNLVAVEGGLGANEGLAMRDGRLRVRGHALPDTLVSHMGALEAAEACWIRSVRLAVHPDHRGRGVASALAEHVHAHHLDPARDHGPVDGFGTLFGAVPHVVRLRQRLGYRLVRLGAARGSRTGEPSAVMVRPVSPRAHQLVDRLSARTARDLDLLLALLHGDGQLPLDPELVDTLRGGLPAPAPMSTEERDEAVHAYVHGPRPFEAAAAALRAWLPTTDRSAWTDIERGLVQDRLFDTRSWKATATRAGLPHPRAAMRALKRACRRLPMP